MLQKWAKPRFYNFVRSGSPFFREMLPKLTETKENLFSSNRIGFRKLLAPFSGFALNGTFNQIIINGPDRNGLGPRH